MSQSAQAISAFDILTVPIGTNLATPSTRTKTPYPGSVGYDAGLNKLYYGGTNNLWNVLGSGSGDVTGVPPSTVGNIVIFDNTTSTLITDSQSRIGTNTDIGNTNSIGDANTIGNTNTIGDTNTIGNTNNIGDNNSIGDNVTIETGAFVSGSNTGDVTLAAVDTGAANANAANITVGQVLSLTSATSSFPGVVNTAAQTFTGVKTFTNGIIVETPVTSGVSNLFNEFCMINYSLGVMWTGPVTVTQNMFVQRVGQTAFIGAGAVYGTTSVGGIMTCSQTLTSEFRPGTAHRGGSLPVMVNGTLQTGYFQVSMAGVITVGTGLASDGITLVGFTAGSGTSGITDCIMTYDLY